MIQQDEGFTDLAFQSNDGRYAGDEALTPIFDVRPKINPTKSEEEGRPIYEDTVYVTIYSPGNKDSIPCRPVTEMDIARFKGPYDRFMETQSNDVVEGTMLDEWPAITRSQVEELRYMNIRTVEQLVAMSDANAQQVMGINQLQKQAKEYLEAHDKNDALIASLQARVEELEKGSEDPEEVKKPRRGRPPKTEKMSPEVSGKPEE